MSDIKTHIRRQLEKLPRPSQPAPQPEPTQVAFRFPTKSETFCDVITGEKSASGLLELHWNDPDGCPRFLILPERAQHELVYILLWERRRDIASPEAVADMEALRL
jgi:hypothetical protein